jgi:hypothetical protein
MKKRCVSERVFKCEKCGNKMIAYKKTSHGTSQGHIKHMWCYKCMERTAHIQQTKWD